MEWSCSNSATSLGFSSNSSPLAISTTSLVTSSIEVLIFSKSSMRFGINFFQTPVNVDIFTASHKSKMFLMASRVLIPENFQFMLPRSIIGISIYGSHNLNKMFFFNDNKTWKLRWLLDLWVAEWMLCWQTWKYHHSYTFPSQLLGNEVHCQ